MFALVVKEIERNKISFAIYCLISISIVFLYVSLFPSIQDQSEQLSELMNTMPKAMMDAFGIDKDSFDSIEKYLAVELMSIFWPLLVILLSTSRAGACISGDIENRTLGLELSLPISRIKIFISKFLGNWSALFVFCCISIFSIAPICLIFGIEIEVSKVYILFVHGLLFATTVLSVGLLFSAFLSEKGKVFFSVGGILLVSYIANIVANLSSGFSWLKHFSIFYYYDTLELLDSGKLNSSSVIFFSAVSLISISFGLWKFRQRDIGI